jgi:hypothetical protein
VTFWRKNGDVRVGTNMAGNTMVLTKADKEIDALNDKIANLETKVRSEKENIDILTGKSTVDTSALEKERIKREAQLAKMQRDATADELAKKLAREREVRLDAEFKALEEIAKMDSEAIKDELERNESNIRLEASMKVAEKDRELKKAKVSQQDHDRLLEDFRVSTYKAAERQIEDLKEKSRREDELKAESLPKRFWLLLTVCMSKK